MVSEPLSTGKPTTRASVFTWHRWVKWLLIVVLWADANAIAFVLLDESDTESNPPFTPPPQDVLDKYKEEFVSRGWIWDRTSFAYRLLRPANADSTKKYPLIVYLHGAGARGKDNVQQLKGLAAFFTRPPFCEEFPCYVLAPQCPRGRSWPEYQWQSEPEIPAEPIVMMMLMEVLASDSVDPDRVYLVGYSMGGFAAWDLASQYPDRFAAAIPIAGGGHKDQAESLVGLPIWAIHGEDDETVDIELSRRVVDAIEAAGGTPRFSPLASVGHGPMEWVTDPNNGVFEWLFTQKRPQRDSIKESL